MNKIEANQDEEHAPPPTKFLLINGIKLSPLSYLHPLGIHTAIISVRSNLSFQAWTSF